MLKTKPSRPKTVKSEGGEAGSGTQTDKQKANTAAAVAAKKRRAAQKKKESDGGDTGDTKKRTTQDSRKHLTTPGFHVLHHAHEDRRYERAPRLLPEITGVKSLSSSEIQSDLKSIQSALATYEAKVQALLPPGAPNPFGPGPGYLSGNNKETMLSMEDAYGPSSSFMYQKRRARPNGVITPEEVVESLPICRRAVRITQRELAAMKRERDDLERDYMRLRCKLIWQIGEMKRIQKQQDRTLRVLGKDVVERAKTLESSRRRTNALQDIMTELEARGSAIVRLTREKVQLEALVQKHGLPLPEIEEVYIGDRVECPFGKGRVRAMDDVKRVITIELDGSSAIAYVQEDDVEVLASDVTYLDAEKDLKQKFFDKIGALVAPNGRFSALAASSRSGGRRRSSRVDVDADSDVDMDEDSGDEDADDDADDDDNDDNDEDEDGVDGEDGYGVDESRRRPSSTDVDVDADPQRRKKRKLHMMGAAQSGSTKKKQRSGSSKVLDFTACKIPITPYESGLLLSPLSTLPERVAAVGPGALQWMSSYLPSTMAEWERDKYQSLQMQGEIERLRFQLERAEAEKLDAQQHASDQVDSINQLVTQLDKLREQLAVKDGKEKDGESACCPNCGTSSAKKGTGLSSSKGSSGAKANGKAAPSTSKKDTSATRRPRSDSTIESNDDEAASDGSQQRKSKRGKQEDHDEEENEGEHDDVDATRNKDGDQPHDEEDYDDGADESDGSSRSKTRSLRPRRQARTTSSASDKSTK